MKRYVSFALFVLGIAGCSFAAYRLGSNRAEQLASTGGSDLVSNQGLVVTPPPVGNKRSDQFARVSLPTHEGKPIRFYEDLAKEKKIACNFM